MTPPSVAIIATVRTKSQEANYLKDCIEALGATCTILDSSIASDGRVLSGDEKLAAMEVAARSCGNRLTELSKSGDLQAVVGIGGGTGSQIAAGAFASSDTGAWKVMITTQAFDTRVVPGLEDAIIVPSIADIEGLNRVTTEVLKGAASAVAGLAKARPRRREYGTGALVAITAMGVTSEGVRAAKSLLEANRIECVAFHAVGIGGSTMARMAGRRTFDGILDYTTHELTSLCLDAETGVSEARFDAPEDCARVMLPGGVNFVTRARGRTFELDAAGRQQYPHSREFTHVGLFAEEMAELGSTLARKVMGSEPAPAMILPMGGFSSEDRPGGMLENVDGRQAFADAFESEIGGKATVLRIEGHINDQATGQLAAEHLKTALAARSKD